MQSKKIVTSDFQIPGFPEIIHVKQFDANTRYIRWQIADAGQEFTPPSNAVYMVGVHLADGTEILYDRIINATAPLGVVVSVDPVKWAENAIASGTFTKTATGWSLAGVSVDLDDYGITITHGTPTTGSTIAVTSEDAVTIDGAFADVAIAPSACLISGCGTIELYIGSGDELISTYHKELHVEKASVNPNNAFTPQSYAMLTAQIEAYVKAWLIANPTVLTDAIAAYIQAHPASITDEVDAWIEANPAIVKAIISAVLSEHPDWVTTVTDGSIGEAKLTAALKRQLLFIGTDGTENKLYTYKEA